MVGFLPELVGYSWFPAVLWLDHPHGAEEPVPMAVLAEQRDAQLRSLSCPQWKPVWGWDTAGDGSSLQ